MEKTQPDIERDLEVLTYKQCFLIAIDVALQLCPCSDFGLKNGGETAKLNPFET